MSVMNFQLSGYQRARCWVDEFPEMSKLSSFTRISRINSIGGSAVRLRQAAIEWLVPGGVSMYGLLGAELYPAEKDFTIKVCSTSSSLGSFEGTIASKVSEDVKVGLLDEYAQAVIDGMSNAAMQLQSLPSATVVCNLAACGVVGSSAKIFNVLAGALIKLLVVSENPSEEDLKGLLVL